MKKFVVTSDYKNPKFNTKTEYDFNVIEAILKENSVQLLIYVEALKEFIEEGDLFIEEIPFDSEVFSMILEYMYLEEAGKIIEIDECDFSNFSWRGHFKRVGGKMEIDWPNIKACDGPISALSDVYEEYKGYTIEEIQRKLVENA